MSLLEFVLTNNYITFMDTTYLQLCGTAMGTPIAVMYANIVLFDIEQKVVALNPYAYDRFLDDVFAIPNGEQHATDIIDTFNSVCPSIQFESVTIGNSGIFLDLMAEIIVSATGEHTLRTSVYQKPINKYLYLTPTSNHERRIFRNFIVSEFSRYRLHCTDHNDFLECARKFSVRLKKRGYNEKWIGMCYKQVPSKEKLMSKLYSPPTKSHSIGPVMIVDRAAIRSVPVTALSTLHLPDEVTHHRSYEQKFKGKPIMYALRNQPSIGKYLLTSVHPRRPKPKGM